MAGHPDNCPPGFGPDEVVGAATVGDLARLLRTLRRREARRRGGAELTYRELAGKAGWSHTMVADYLTGKTLPPTDRFDTLIRLLGATPVEQGALATARDQVDEGRRARPTPTAHPMPVPRQLPADVPGFVGRRPALTVLDRLAPPARTMTLVAVTGGPGVGKSALAVHWAHRVEHQFPDGQLYADLRGFSPDPPASPERILDSCLTALGVPPTAVPLDLDAKAGLYRSLLANRRLLVVLDNAADPQQVRPLLPGTPGCLALVTSRDALTGLIARDRAHRLQLEAPPVAEAVELLAGFLGPRAAAEPDAVQELAILCDQLPVALCAVGERVSAHPNLTLREFVTDLAGDRRLDLLEVNGDRRASVRSVFSFSYQRLPAPAARLFRLLGLHLGCDLDRCAAAALAGTAPARVDHLIRTLLTANLLWEHQPGRYRLPDLLRRYAAECALRHDSARQRQAALTRLADYYRTTMKVTVDTLTGTLSGTG